MSRATASNRSRTPESATAAASGASGRRSLAHCAGNSCRYLFPTTIAMTHKMRSLFSLANFLSMCTTDVQGRSHLSEPCVHFSPEIGQAIVEHWHDHGLKNVV